MRTARGSAQGLLVEGVLLICENGRSKVGQAAVAVSTLVTIAGNLMQYRCEELVARPCKAPQEISPVPTTCYAVDANTTQCPLVEPVEEHIREISSYQHLDGLIRVPSSSFSSSYHHRPLLQGLFSESLSSCRCAVP